MAGDILHPGRDSYPDTEMFSPAGIGKASNHVLHEKARHKSHWMREPGMKSFRHRRGRFHRQHARRSPARRRPRRWSATTTSRPARNVPGRGGTSDAGFRLVRGDTLDLPALTEAMAGPTMVFHLAANADVRFGTEHPRKDLEQNTIATFNVLEAMRANGVPRIAFSSTGSIYGEAAVIPTPEDAPFPVQTSLYGASKLAGEGLIAAYCEGFGIQGCIFRFVSILGERYTHGHVFDFYKNLRRDPTRLRVLGNGHQRKSYLYVQDCVDAILARARARRRTGQHLQSRHRRVLRGERLDRLDLRAISASRRCSSTPAAIAAGSATTRSSSSTPRRSAPGLAAAAHDPRRGRPDAGVPPAEPATCSSSAHEGRGPRPVAPRLGDGRVHRRAPGTTVTGWDPDAATVARLSGGAAPIAEPGLDALVAGGTRRRPAAVHVGPRRGGGGRGGGLDRLRHTSGRRGSRRRRGGDRPRASGASST